MGEKARPQCYFDVEINREPIGRMVFQLFSDVCPETCMNFLCLCTGEKGIGKVTGKKLCYKGSTFHRVVKNFMIQGGDFSEGNGKGGESIYGGYFKDENFILKHDRAFLLSMANRGKNTNGSQFFITTKAAPHLDGVHVVFGLVISGFEVIEQIESLKTDAASRPYADVRVIDCELLVSKPAREEKTKRAPSQPEESEFSFKSTTPSSSPTSSESCSSESEAEIERHRRKKRKQKTKVKHSKRRRKESSRKEEAREKSPSREEHSPQSVNTHETDDKGLTSKRGKPIVRPEEIPPVPENRFLLRKDVPVVKPEPEQKPASVEPEKNDQQNAPLSKSGRRIRGRGTIRYHTPPRSKSRSESEEEGESSETPPHWKEEMQRLRAYKPSSGEKWSKGDKLNDRLSSEWEEGNVSQRSSSWSPDGCHSDGSRRRGSRCKNRKKEKKIKHKKKSKKLKHSKKRKPSKRDQSLVSKEGVHLSSNRKSKSSKERIKRSLSASSRDSSKKHLSRSDKGNGSSVHSSRGTLSDSRSRSYSRESVRSRTSSKSSSHSRSDSRGRSPVKARPRHRKKSGSLSNSVTQSSGSKQLKTVSSPPKNKEPPLVESKPVPVVDQGKPTVHQTEKTALPAVTTDNIPEIPISDSPPPSRWKPGQKPWKSSYEKVQEVKSKASSVLPLKGRHTVKDTSSRTRRKRQASSDSDHSDYSSCRQKSRMRSSPSRSYSKSYSRSRSRSTSSSEATSRSDSSYDLCSSYDSKDRRRSRRSGLRKQTRSRGKNTRSKSPESRSKEINSSKGKESNSDSGTSSDTEKEAYQNIVMETTKALEDLKNHIGIKRTPEQNDNKDASLDKQLEKAENSSDIIQAVLPEKSDELKEKPSDVGQLSNRERNASNLSAGKLASSEKEEGEASSESDTEVISKSATPSGSKNSPSGNIQESLPKSQSSASPSPDHSKSKSKKRKQRSSKKSSKKSHMKKNKEKSKKKKEKKHKAQKKKPVFHWQPPLEFGEEEEAVMEEPDIKKNSVAEKHSRTQNKSMEDVRQCTKNSTNGKTLRVKEEISKEEIKSLNLGSQESRGKTQTNTKKLQSLTVGLAQSPTSRKTGNGSLSSSRVKEESSSPAKGQSSISGVTNDQNAPVTAASIADKFQVQEEKTVGAMLEPGDAANPEKGNSGNSEAAAAALDNKWKPVQGQSILQMMKSSSVPLATPTEQEKKSQVLRIEIKSKNKVRPGSLFDEVRKTARLNQRPRNQDSSSEERSSSEDEKSRSASQARSRSKSRSASSHRSRSLSYSRSRSRSRSYSYSSRSRSYTRSQSRGTYRRCRTRSRSRSYRSYSRSYSRSRSRSSHDRRRRSRSRSHTYDSYDSRSRSRSPNYHRSRSYDRRSRSQRSYDSYSGSDRSYSHRRRHSGRS